MRYYIDLWKRAFDYKGKSSRKEFWIPFAINSCVAVVALVFALLTLNGFPVIGPIVVLLLGYLAVSAVPFVALTVRRLHDTGRSGWWYLLVLFAGIGAVVLGIMLAGKAMPFSAWMNIPVNIYGPPRDINHGGFNPSDNISEVVYGPPEFFE